MAASLEPILVKIPADLHWQMSTKDLTRVAELSSKVFTVKFNDLNQSTYQMSIKSEAGKTPRISSFEFSSMQPLEPVMLVQRSRGTAYSIIVPKDLAQIPKKTIENFKSFLIQKLSSSYSQLEKACASDNLPQLQQLWAEGVDLLACDKQGNTALHIAAVNNSTQCIEFLISNGVCVDVCNKAGITPLHCACYNGNLQAYELLVNKNANVDSTCQKGCNILHYAAESDDLELLKTLLNEHPNLIYKENIKGHNIAIYLTFRGETALLEDLLVRRPDLVNSKGKDRKTLLHCAAEKGHTGCIQVLLNNGANPKLRDNNFETPMSRAQEKNQTEAITVLKQHRSKK
ncbi:ankyrin repeat domain-containing protein [Parashewanella curva]|uniref:Ankyrin repeat domain-containing protein n=1 Tax=Parashewanella curva TaxID=2338552 RepID=A0A3L8Q1K0_9GAMM|nr:ankyrin repeat domain-containing protein [Parashewanella curva]RLV61465.1 ankyrin repeat domain-containing protein [Parashewanella curva]